MTPEQIVKVRDRCQRGTYYSPTRHCGCGLGGGLDLAAIRAALDPSPEDEQHVSP